jgi:hypothetical protein
MRRSASRRRATEPRSRRVRLIAAAGALVVFGALIGVTQISNAEEGDGQAQTTAGKTVNGLEILANDCSESQLEAHDGFQKGDRCVSTEFGEVGVAANNPSLLIVSAPRTVVAGQPFTLRVSTRNLIRDRFLAAGQGGYYVESSVLQGGIVRGHFHTACRLLGSTRVAPDPAPVPAFFVATEDRQGGQAPDTVSIQVPGLPAAGNAQCASWAGDGSHRIPMMERANQTPAFDAVRIRVRAAREQPPAEQPPAEQPPAEEPPPAEEQPPADGGGQDQGGGDQQGEGGGDQSNVPPVPADVNTDSAPVQKPAKPSNSTKSSGTKSSGTNSSGTESSDSESSDSEDGEAVPAQSIQSLTGNSKSLKPKSESKSAAKAKPAAKTEAEEEAVVDDGAPDPGQAEAAPVAASNDTNDDGGLALTGGKTIYVIGGGVLAIIIGFLIFGTSRRHRPRSHWR